jgi:hypothetical protein
MVSVTWLLNGIPFDYLFMYQQINTVLIESLKEKGDKMSIAKKLFLYSVCIAISVTFLAPARSASLDGPNITSAHIKEKQLKGGTRVTIIKPDLVSDRHAFIEGTATGGDIGVEKVEVSLDNGRTWHTATGNENWQYQFEPVPKQTYYLAFRVTNSSGIVSQPGAYGTIRLTYFPITLSALIQQRADALARAYSSKRLGKYMKMISKQYENYPRGWHKLRQAIQNDFRSFNNIVLRFTVNQVFKLEKVIMADIRWTITHAGLTMPEEGYVEIHFDRNDDLKIRVQRKDLYFSETPIGYNARIQLEWVDPVVRIIVTDLDMVGARTITIRVSGRCTAGTVRINRRIRLTESPPRSGRFVGICACFLDPGAPDFLTAIYKDQMTSSWRRNVNRTETIGR